jgi:hypothetical protein
MSRRVRIAAVALLALSLVLQTPSASAATRDREVLNPGFIERVIRTVRKVLKPLTPGVQDDVPTPGPPKP